jgi:hypothetical protein
LKTAGEEHFAVDPDKIDEDKKSRAFSTLGTNTDLNPLDVMLCYKRL